MDDDTVTIPMEEYSALLRLALEAASHDAVSAEAFRLLGEHMYPRTMNAAADRLEVAL